MSMKPDWSLAPEWANYMAQDKDGEWRVFENMPIVDEPAGIHRPNNGRHQPIKHWTQTTERRP